MSAAQLALAEPASNPVQAARCPAGRDAERFAPAPFAVSYLEGRGGWELGWPSTAVEAAKSLCRTAGRAPSELRARDVEGHHLVARRDGAAIAHVAVIRFGPDPATLNAAFAVLAAQDWLPGREWGDAIAMPESLR